MLRILVVEDEIKLLMSLKKELEEKDYQVVVALDEAVARYIIEVGVLNLIILDINLTATDGYALCRAIRVINPQIPIIILSADGSLENKLLGFDAGADDYLIKPFEFSELLARIHVFLKRSQQTSAPVNMKLSMADLVLDLRAKTVSRSGQLISITSRELDLLEYFMRHPGAVISRNEIAENVWETGINTNLIDVYVYALRKKIDKDFPTKLIHTRIGMGYIMQVA